jgi:hypothetical protein
LIILLGVVHIVLTPVWFDEFVMRVMWYIAQGLMAILVGFVNIMAARNRWHDPVTVRLCHTANLLGLGFVVIYSFVDPAPPSYAAIAILVGVVIGALSSTRHAARN